MAELTDSRAERLAKALAEGEPILQAFRAAYGTGDLVLFHQVKDRQDIADRVLELQAGE